MSLVSFLVSDWCVVVSPNVTRVIFENESVMKSRGLVGEEGLEPPTSCL